MGQNKILIVEDDAFLRDGLTELLKREGYLPAAAENLQEARRLVSDTAFSLILLDAYLKGGNPLPFSLREGDLALLHNDISELVFPKIDANQKIDT